MSDDERDEKELDLTSPDVVTKYKSAAEIVNKALQLVISECKPNVKIVDICEKGDSFIREQTGKLYKNVKKKIERGVAFPTCISVNNTVCHFSPLASDETVLEVGDILKIDLACHIDGFIAAVAHTHVLQEGPITGRAADVIAAANTAAEVALRLVRPGKKMSGIGRPKGRPRGSGGKGNGKVPTIPTSLEQRSTTKYTTPRVVTPSPSSSNHGAPLGTVPIPSIPSSSEQMNTSKNTTPNDSTQSPSSSNPSVHLSTSHVPSPITERTPTPLTEEDNDHNSQPENFIPFGDPTLPGPHNPHLPWGKDLTDNKIWIYTLKGYFYPDDKVTKDISKAIKSMFDGPYNNWKCCNDKIKKMWFNEWMKNYKWIGEQEATIKATWESKAKDLLRKIMARVREKVSEKPKWITHAVWAQLLAMWEDDHYMTNRCVAASNRDSDVGGSLHTQGSKNQLKHELELNKRLGRIPHKGELFKKCHTRKGSQTFVDKRSSDAHTNFVNLCSQAESQPHPSEAGNDESGTQPKPIDYDTLMIEAVGGRNAKGRVYGLGLDGSMRTRGSTSKSNKYSNYTDIARGMSGEVEARLRQTIADQQQTINSIMARQNKMIAAFAKHANIDLDLMDLDEDDHSTDISTLGSNANVGADVEE